MKMHNEKSVLVEIESALVNVWFFYIREKNDINGNPRYRVFISDPDASVIYETIFKCYEFQISERVKAFIETKGGC